MSNIFYGYKCETGCGHTTLIDKQYKKKRIPCGVCDEISTMVYQGEYKVDKLVSNFPFKGKLVDK